MKPRDLLLLALLCALAMSLSACGSDDDDDDDTILPNDDDVQPNDDDTVWEPDWVEAPLIRYVNPFIGTGGVGFGVGSTYPGPARPFGMIHPSPDTAKNGVSPGINHCSGYYYLDNEIVGFSHTRLNGTGVPLQGNVLLMPTDGLDTEMIVDEAYRSSFDKETEEAAVGYYAVTLAEYDVRAELTSGLRAAIHRYTWPVGAKRWVLLDPTHTAGDDGRVESAHVRREGDTLLGYAHDMTGLSGRDGGTRVYFAVRFDAAIDATKVWADDALTELAEYTGTDGGMAVRLAEGEGPVQVAIGISWIDEAQALAHLEEEAANFDFAGMREQTEAAWETELSRIRIAGGSEDERIRFYSSLYRVYLMPTLFTSSDGRYRGYDKQVHDAEGFTYYSDFSMWDTFRNFHPLIILLDEERARDFAISLITKAEQGGGLPRWGTGTGYGKSMIGNASEMVLAETWLKGNRDWDGDLAFTWMLRNATDKGLSDRAPGRGGGMDHYMEHGWIPGEVSETLEYAYNDWSTGLMAQALGHEDYAEWLLERAMSYRKNWDSETDFMRGKNEDGSWMEPFDPLQMVNVYTEGNAWHWSWYAPHDVPGLIGLFDSEQAFEAKLVTFFEESALMKPVPGMTPNLAPDLYYWHGNEPDMHAAYMFNDVGRMDLAQRWSREVLDQKYTSGPDGLPGNDDGGTMSAWYVFAALGIYPIAGDTPYWLGSPVFEAATIHRNRGDIEIRAEGASTENWSAPEILLDGEPVEGRIDHAQIDGGATLEFKMELE